MQEVFVKTHWNNLAKKLDLPAIFKLRSTNKTWYYLSRAVDFKILSDKVEKREDKLKLLFTWYSWLPKQGSKEWIEQRQGISKDSYDEILERIHGYYTQKPPTIGGSEISSVLGNNHFTNREQLIQRKLGNDKFTGNIDTRWGKMMEPVITQYTEYIFSCEIDETGSIPGIRNEYGHAISSYSPDGLAVVSKQAINSYFNNIADSEKIVLFEFKCPRRRKPTDMIPEHYLSQPLMGMCVIPIAEMGIFGDGVFRMCSSNNFAWNSSYSTWFHNTDRGSFCRTPKALGFLGLYRERVKFSETPVQDLVCYVLQDLEFQNKFSGLEINRLKFMSFLARKAHELESMHVYSTMEILQALNYWKNTSQEIQKEQEILQEFSLAWKPTFHNRIHDFGNYGSNFEDSVYYIDNNPNTAGYWYPDKFLDYNNDKDRSVKPQNWLNEKIDEFILWCEKNNKEYMGIVPWKLMDIRFIHVPKQSDYLEKCLPHIRETIDEIQLLKANPNTEKKNNNEDSDILPDYNDQELMELTELLL